METLRLVGRFRVNFSAVADDFALDHIHDVLGDIGGVVCDPLQVPRHGKQVGGALDGFRIPLHHPPDHIDDLAVVVVHYIVLGADPAGGVSVAGHESSQTFANHP